MFLRSSRRILRWPIDENINAPVIRFRQGIVWLQAPRPVDSHGFSPAARTGTLHHGDNLVGNAAVYVLLFFGHPLQLAEIGRFGKRL